MNLSEFRKSDLTRQPHLLLLGHPVSHSLSPLMHNTAAAYYGLDVTYCAIDLLENEFSSLASHFNRESFRGSNITVPYKEVLVDYVDELDRSAAEIGAINTIYKSSHTLVGANTDVYGFLAPLEQARAGVELDGSRAVVFGTGGASRAVAAGLLRLGVVEIFLVSRRPAQFVTSGWPEPVRVTGYGEWPAFAEEAVILINTTPLGMEPNEDTSPVREEEKELMQGKICYDVVYNPVRTTFLRTAEEAGAAATIGGLEMLLHQGSKAFELWTGKPFPLEIIRQKLYDHFEQ